MLVCVTVNNSGIIVSVITEESISVASDYRGGGSTCVGKINLECYFLFYSCPFLSPLTVIFPLMLLFPLFVLVHDPIRLA